MLAAFFFLANRNSFLWPLTVTSNPDVRVVQTGLATFQQRYSSARNYIMAASTVVAMPTMLLFIIVQRQLVESIEASGFNARSRRRSEPVPCSWTVERALEQRRGVEPRSRRDCHPVPRFRQSPGGIAGGRGG